MKRAQHIIIAKRLRKFSPLRPTLGMVLGSGFDHVLSQLQVDFRIRYQDLPGFPPVGVTGHSGELLIGLLEKTPLIVLSGRAHYYEGCELSAVTFGVRVLAAYGIRDLLLTNAAGAINRRFRPGDLMVITDHVNFMGVNPLRGNAALDGMRFIDLTRTYDTGLQELLHRAARRSGIMLRSGVYLAVSGPSYETPAEIRAFAMLGADVVGMSTVPEAIVARQCQVRVAGLSRITNFAAGLGKHPISHKEVLEMSKRTNNSGTNLLKNFARLYQAEEGGDGSA